MNYPNYRISEDLFKKILQNSDVNVRIEENLYNGTDAVYASAEPIRHIIIDIKETLQNTQISENIKSVVKTDVFINTVMLEDQDRKIWSSPRNFPKINFKTGEIKDKPGTFLNFDKPETLDEQLAEIYGLTVEEQELMASSIKPWKDKLSLTADGLY